MLILNLNFVHPVVIYFLYLRYQILFITSVSEINSYNYLFCIV